MVEVYNILNQPPSNNSRIAMVMFGVVGGVFFLISLISLIKMITSKNVFIKKIVINVLSMAFLVAWVTFVMFIISGEQRLYKDYCGALESGAYSVESGEPVRLEFYPHDNSEENIAYNVSFLINDKYFDSGRGCGADFSESDIEFIKSYDTFEVKYIVDEEKDNIILSISVGEKADQER